LSCSVLYCVHVLFSERSKCKQEVTLLSRHFWKSSFMSVTGTRSWGLFGPDMDATTVDRSSSNTCTWFGAVCYVTTGVYNRIEQCIRMGQYIRIRQYIRIGQCKDEAIH